MIIRKLLTKIILKNPLKTTTGVYFNYENIPLKLYFDVITTYDYSKLQISGKQNKDKCIEAWENIIKRNSLATKNNQYVAYFNAHKSFNLLLNDYTTIKAILDKLKYVIDRENIEYLEKKGYKISTKNSFEYEQSLISAIKKSDNLVTKIKMKQNELNTYNSGDNKPPSFEEVLASLTLELGFVVNDDLTLARYNEYEKLIRKKHERYKKTGHNRR